MFIQSLQHKIYIECFLRKHQHKYYTVNVSCLQIIEKMRVRSEQIQITIVDRRKAYDTVPIVMLWEVLLRNTYEDSKARIKQNSKLSVYLPATEILCQRCCLSPIEIYVSKANGSGSVMEWE